MRDAFGLEIRPGRADDLHAALLRQLGQELDVAAEIHRAGIHEGPDAEIAELLHLIDGAGHGLANARNAAPTRRDSSPGTRSARARG